MALERNLVILVDRQDNERGTADKLEAHRSGKLHRALSVFIINGKGEMLLQKRAAGKYHSAGLWSNACCSHPTPGEPTIEAALRRLREELGFDTPLEPIGEWYYRADVGAGLVEHELDHLFTGTWEGIPSPDPQEVSETKWVSINEIQEAVQSQPDDFTAWFPQIFARWQQRHVQSI